MLAKPVTVKELKAAVSAGRDQLQMAGLKVAAVDWHNSRSTSAKQSGKVSESQSCALCQPGPVP